MTLTPRAQRKNIGMLSIGIVSLALAAAGCRREQPVTMAPPMTQSAPPMTQSAPPVGQSGGPASAGADTVYNWRDVPQGQQVPISRAAFDQGGYQLYAASGETIVIPFENQNMYVLKFGQTSGDMYFINDGNAPTLYIPRGGALENASAQGARWYPFSQGYNYERPVYVGLAPTWSAFTGMGWYPGMSYYGGYWGYQPGITFSPMSGLYFNIGGHPYYGWNSYYDYYRRTPYNRVSVTRNYNYNSVGRRSASSFGTGRSSSGSGRRGTTGSFGSGRTSSGSFGSGRPASSSSGSFGSGRTSSGFGSGRSSGSGSSTFGSGRTGSSTFGSGSTRPSGSFGGSSSGFSGSSSRPSGSFGSSGSSSRPSFGGSSSSGSSFGGSRSSGSSFGGGRSSSFGGGRRR